jgi:hypothetical protein
MNEKLFSMVASLSRLPGVPQSRGELVNFLRNTGYGKGRPEPVERLTEYLSDQSAQKGFLATASEEHVFTLVCCLLSHEGQGMASIPGEEIDWSKFASAIEALVPKR